MYNRDIRQAAVGAGIRLWQLSSLVVRLHVPGLMALYVEVPTFESVDKASRIKAG